MPLFGLEPDTLHFRLRNLDEFNNDPSLKNIGHNLAIGFDVSCRCTVDGTHENPRYIDRTSIKEIGRQLDPHAGDFSLDEFTADPAHVCWRADSHAAASKDDFPQGSC